MCDATERLNIIHTFMRISVRGFHYCEGDNKLHFVEYSCHKVTYYCETTSFIQTSFLSCASCQLYDIIHIVHRVNSSFTE